MPFPALTGWFPERTSLISPASRSRLPRLPCSAGAVGTGLRSARALCARCPSRLAHAAVGVVVIIVASCLDLLDLFFFYFFFPFFSISCLLLLLHPFFFSPSGPLDSLCNPPPSTSISLISRNQGHGHLALGASSRLQHRQPVLLDYCPSWLFGSCLSVPGLRYPPHQELTY